jgi:16S rRNA (guanine966-N2)-methyltransferase
MRVIAGAYGGRTLRAPRGAATRPTPERVREALFSALGSLEGAVVLDLFAGSGALGIEALSRGAAKAVFVDSAERATDAVIANLAGLGIAGPAAQVHREDALRFLRRAGEGDERFDLVFLDPPYSEAVELGPVLTEVVPKVLADGARVVGESDRRAPLELGLEVARERRYGDTLLRIWG